MSRIRYPIVLAVLAVLAGSGVGTAVAELRHNSRVTRANARVAAARIYQTDSSRTFTATRQILDAPLTLQRMSVTGHGGTAIIEWYCGAWVSAGGHGAAADLVLDGRELVETVKSGPGGAHDARAGMLRWVGRLPAGPHTVAVLLEDAPGGIAPPSHAAGMPIQESLAVTEHVG